jgi:tRNA(Ile)-lysidine synthase
MSLENKVLETIKKYNLIEEYDKLVLGVSGGPDSITMLTILNRLKEKLNFEMVVAHINHGIRENAKLDEEYVKKVCKNLGVECFVLQAQVKQLAMKQKRGLEETGRKVRYDFFR